MSMSRVIRSLKIDRNTARLLSQATYHQLVLCLRELIANSLDANSSTVNVDIKLGKVGSGTITIADDGDGMNQHVFEDEFLSLGSTSKAGEGKRPKKNRFGRPMLGRFGIGFISVVPFAREVIVETKTRDSNTVLGVRVNCQEILAGTGAGGDREWKFEGWNRPANDDDPKSFTRVTLKDLTKQAYESMDASLGGGWYQLRGRRREDVDNELRLDFIAHWLQRILPLGYSDVDASEDLAEKLVGLLPKEYLPATIRVNGKKLTRILAECEFYRAFELQGQEGSWEARGVLWSPQEAISPVHARGVAIRVGDMSIGEPAYLNLNTVGRVYGKLQHIAGEVHVSGLEKDLQLDRQQFYYTPATDEFNTLVRKKIASFESSLQDKAHVMQKLRNVKKSLDSGGVKFKGLKAEVAPILEASKKLEALAKEASDVGIAVVRSRSKNLDVPKGERKVSVGRDVGADLLKIMIGLREIDVKVANRGKTLTTDDLLTGILDGGKDEIHITGPHVLISKDEWALANMRLFAAIKVNILQKKMTRDQARSLLDTLVQSYR